MAHFHPNTGLYVQLLLVSSALGTGSLPGRTLTFWPTLMVIK